MMQRLKLRCFICVPNVGENSERLIASVPLVLSCMLYHLLGEDLGKY